ncbi:spore coat protein U domain-containing protein [Paraburkholderia sp. Se-20369]|nr:spore coat protein U domain-containing protein [Paraburkholderia sp. Se-20369]
MAELRVVGACRTLRRVSCWLLVALLFAPWLPAHADSCTVSAQTTSFGSVSPISQLAYTTTSTVGVTCTWDTLSLNTTALVCLNLGVASPRAMTNGTNQMQYDLYQDNGYTQTWGAVASGTTPMSVTVAKPGLGTTANATLTVYGRIAPNQPTVPSVNNGSTLYSQTFAGNQASYSYNFALLGIQLVPCTSQASAGTFAYATNATVINNCVINATNVAFPATGLLNSALSASGSISAQCTNGDAFQIALNGGGSTNVAARTMQRSGGGGSVAYQLYRDAGFTQPWGDGTSGTSMATGTGSGLAQSITVYGRVPAQATPAPGNYSDTITATISF